MAKGGQGPRQPLARRKPGKVAQDKVQARPGAVLSTRLKKLALGAPPKGKIAKKTEGLGGAANATVPKKRTRSVAVPGPDAATVWDHLIALYPDAHCELDYRSPWELLVATILSAQCTDRRVNMVTPVLFARYPGPAELAIANPDDVEEIIRSTGFFRAKTKSIIGAARALVDRHDGVVPNEMEQLVVLPGVGRKTANVVLGNAFNINEGVVVDTHVSRLSERLRLSVEGDPIRIERDLMELFPRERWALLSHLLIWHGRRICEARRPRCEVCPLNAICPSSLVRYPVSPPGARA
jgi:endonuclease III